MITEYRMPKLAMAMNEGTINEWLVAEGQLVEAGMPIAVIETEKVAYDCESPESGYFLPIVAEGETVDVEVLIGCFCSEESELDVARTQFLNGDAAAATPVAEARPETEAGRPTPRIRTTKVSGPKGIAWLGCGNPEAGACTTHRARQQAETRSETTRSPRALPWTTARQWSG